MFGTQLISTEVLPNLGDIVTHTGTRNADQLHQSFNFRSITIYVCLAHRALVLFSAISVCVRMAAKNFPAAFWIVVVVVAMVAVFFPSGKHPFYLFLTILLENDLGSCTRINHL